MNKALKLIEAAIATASPQQDFLSWLLGKNKAAILEGESLVLFGTGSLGRDMLNALKNHGVYPHFFCDSNPDRVGSKYHGLTIISPEKLKMEYADSNVLIASQTYAADIRKDLINLGFNKHKIIWPTDFDMATALFFTPTNQLTTNRTRSQAEWQEFIKENSEKIEKAYALFEDDKSKQVFVEKIAAMVNFENIGVFTNYLKRNSEPVNDFGLVCFKPYGAENFYYFNNDVFQLVNEEIYVDIGAHDGDSVIEFVNACKNNQKKYKKIIAFEPDPEYFKQLLAYSEGKQNIQCIDSGIWSEKTVLKFRSSANDIIDGSSGFSTLGDIEIKTISLDEFLSGDKVTLIKMDPPGNIIPIALEGAKNTIKKHKPRLILGAYHAFESIFEIPLLVHKIDPTYRLFLRHNSWGIGETDIYAI